MKLLTAIEECRAKGQALLATNFYNAETLLAVLRAAKRCHTGVILQTSPSTIQYLGLNLALSMARGAARDLGVQVWLHLDHATDPELIWRCLDAGYDSVMIDASERSFTENVDLSREVVQRAHALDICVEAELGYVPKLGQDDVTSAGLTTPEDAERFVKETGVDLLAVAIGTAHGFYKHEPHIDFDRLSAIRQRVATPLVMHGGSALAPQVWQEGIRRGITKINFATEIKNCFTKTLQSTLAQTADIDLRKTFPPATAAASALVESKMRVCAMKPRV